MQTDWSRTFRLIPLPWSPSISSNGKRVGTLKPVLVAQRGKKESQLISILYTDSTLFMFLYIIHYTVCMKVEFSELIEASSA